MNKILLICLLLTLIGCKEVNQKSSHNVYGSFDCYKEWRFAYSHWESEGGGIKSSIELTNKGILKSSKDDFSKVINAYRRTLIKNKSKLLYLKYSEENYRALTKLVVDDPSRLMMECPFFAWIEHVIWQEITDVDNNHNLIIDDFSDKPDDMIWDSPFIQRWLIYEIIRNKINQE